MQQQIELLEAAAAADALVRHSSHAAAWRTDGMAEVEDSVTQTGTRPCCSAGARIFCADAMRCLGLGRFLCVMALLRYLDTATCHGGPAAIKCCCYLTFLDMCGV